MATIGQLHKILISYSYFASTLEGQFASKSIFPSYIIGSILCVHF